MRKTCHNHAYSTCDARRTRGSIMVLVVAVLALLAVIGTIYIVSARTARNSANDMQSSYNLDLARGAIVENVRSMIGESAMDSAGNPGGYVAGAGTFGSQSARRWTIREVGVANGVGVTDYNNSYRDQMWLASNLYRFNNDPNDPYADLSILPGFANVAGKAVPAAYNPADGAYDILYSTFAPAPMFNVISGNDVNNPGYFPVGTAAPRAYPNVGDPLAPLEDSLIYLLPFSEASGVRYRYGARILDTSRMANINIGYPGVSPDVVGAHFNSYSICDPATFDAGPTYTGAAVDSPVNLETSRRGAWVVPATVPPQPYLYAWGRQAMLFESSSVDCAPFDMADEIGLRAYGNLGTSLTPRPAMNTSGALLWPNTLGNIAGGALTGNPRRSFYTAYSYSRDMRPFPDPALVNRYQLTSIPNPSDDIWPRFVPYPAKVSANPDISAYTGLTTAEQADYLAIAATNIGTAMWACKFTHQEICAFAANYLTYRWNGWIKTGADAAGFDTYSLPFGPSFVDEKGICIRAGVGPARIAKEYGDSGVDLAAEGTGKIYLGYTAQPFINELAAGLHAVGPDASGNFTLVVSDFAIELYNPYNFALDITDYKLRIKYAAAPAIPDVDVPLDSLGVTCIPAHGYFVVSSKANLHLSAAVAGPRNTKAQSDVMVGSVLTNMATGGKIVLMRKYLSRQDVVNGPPAISYGAIDQYDYTSATAHTQSPPSGALTDEDDFVARPNYAQPDPVSGQPYADWLPSVCNQAAAPSAGAGTMTLGDANTPAATSGFSFPLYVNIAPTPALLTNIGDFNHIMRVCNEINSEFGDPAAVAATDNGVLPGQLYNAIYGTHVPQVINTQCPADATIHFDFRSPGWIYNAAGNPVDPYVSPAAPPASAPKDGDPRAMGLLDFLTFVDRVSDFSLPPDTSVDRSGAAISKLRMPGQINVNTAPAEVLATIPVLGANAKLVGAILAYRWRTTSNDPRIPGPYQSPTYDFSDKLAGGKFPGYGIRSLGELNIPLSIDQSAALFLNDRDQAWASVYNCCTVRSDTFVVYGYLEAVRVNPNYVNAGLPHNNAGDWYGLAVDDPRGATAPNIRVARRRFIAIIDSSGCNYSRTDPRFALPRVIAIKDLPQ